MNFEHESHPPSNTELGSVASHLEASIGFESQQSVGNTAISNSVKVESVSPLDDFDDEPKFLFTPKPSSQIHPITGRSYDADKRLVPQTAFMRPEDAAIIEAKHAAAKREQLAGESEGRTVELSPMEQSRRNGAQRELETITKSFGYKSSIVEDALNIRRSALLLEDSTKKDQALREAKAIFALHNDVGKEWPRLTRLDDKSRGRVQ